MNTSIFSRIELIFWNFAIQALSCSRVARSFLRGGYQLFTWSEISSYAILMGLIAAIGLFSGYLVYFLTVSIR